MKFNDRGESDHLLKAVFVTSARSDYNTMFPVMRAAQDDPEIDCVIFCAGMHLVEKFGSTWRQLEQDGLHISEKVDFFSEKDTVADLTSSMADGVAQFGEALTKHNPDFIVVSGDRVENLPLFLAATCLGIPIAHMCGGDITEGAFDNQVRHTMTKLSHLHFVSMHDHARRVIQMGEDPNRVILSGDAAIDVINDITPMSRQELATSYDIPETGAICLSTFHPQTLGQDDFVQQYENLLAVLSNCEETPILIFPNIDPGHDRLVQMLNEFMKVRPDAVCRKSFSKLAFYSLLSHCRYMIGNSSTGLWEAPSFGLPAINVGRRQDGRLRAKNVIDVSGNDVQEIETAVARARSMQFRTSLQGMKNPYGDGEATTTILDTLKSTDRNDELMVKKFFELDFDVPQYGG